MKILIADSGSTKTDWVITDGSREYLRHRTQGLNPMYATPEVIAQSVELVMTLAGEHTDVKSVYFYGSGCAGERIPYMQEALHRFFESKVDVEVYSDLLGAARALYGRGSGLACIVGTGAIACRYDGMTGGMRTASSLGYILGDEGSGCNLGRLLLADYLKEQMPADMSRKFEAMFGAVTPVQAIEHVYRLPFPNRYLASFAPFIGENLDSEYVYNLAYGGLDAFCRRNIARLHPEAGEPVAFVGSVAFHLKKVLADVAAKHGFTLGQVVQSPIDGLCAYHAVK